jgi:hypothetical protein
MCFHGQKYNIASQTLIAHKEPRIVRQKGFIPAANANAAASSTSNEEYEPVESNARPNITGPMAPAAA